MLTYFIMSCPDFYRGIFLKIKCALLAVFLVTFIHQFLFMGRKHLANANVVAVMFKKGQGHTEAFKEMSNNLGITSEALRDSCVRRIGLKGVKDF